MLITTQDQDKNKPGDAHERVADTHHNHIYHAAPVPGHEADDNADKGG